MKLILLLALAAPLGPSDLQDAQMEQGMIVRQVVIMHEQFCMIETKIMILE